MPGCRGQHSTAGAGASSRRTPQRTPTTTTGPRCWCGTAPPTATWATRRQARRPDCACVPMCVLGRGPSAAPCTLGSLCRSRWPAPALHWQQRGRPRWARCRAVPVPRQAGDDCGRAAAAGPAQADRRPDGAALAAAATQDPVLSPSAAGSRLQLPTVLMICRRLQAARAGRSLHSRPVRQQVPGAGQPSGQGPPP